MNTYEVDDSYERGYNAGLKDGAQQWRDAVSDPPKERGLYITWSLLTGRCVDLYDPDSGFDFSDKDKWCEFPASPAPDGKGE